MFVAGNQNETRDLVMTVNMIGSDMGDESRQIVKRPFYNLR
jgi:hypothetical protein